ncbi:hypothetical protein CPB84DRAFT_1743025 [Gymnopilus junonius]|uniref:Uncharacterized protein n=1 Tax=Gymnopilus junonius TaxID=109634 RepID=A0A9P5TUL9_GYMJU|nr:hypothetical protein CPB84DRAFT_1743025 [Gymnopilus junonius]
MPKTRNITRAQWDAANTSTSTRRRRNGNENTYESEKENDGRVTASATRLHTTRRTRATPLGTANATVLGASTAGKGLGEKTRTASKGKDKPLKAPLKRKKMPLQDITDQFLPAPEAANRGEHTQDEENDENIEASANVNQVVAVMPPSETPVTIPPPKFTSPLPPSSPPSEALGSPILSKQSIPHFLDNLRHSSHPIVPQEHCDPWSEFDSAHAPSADSPAHISSNSDPFGFVSLERKLKAEREFAAFLEPQGEQDDEDDIHVLVADTSSPRPVRRLTRSVRDGAAPMLPVPTSCMPPTPHKDRQKRRRMSSHEGFDVFSPCLRRKRPAPPMHDTPLDEFNKELDRSYEVEKTLKKARSSKQVPEPEAENEHGSADPQSVHRSLRPRQKRPLLEHDDEGPIEIKRSTISTKARASKKPVSKARSVGKKMEKPEASGDEGEDLEEKWERERQDRIEYFKRLEEYSVEKEDVYLI